MKFEDLFYKRFDIDLSINEIFFILLILCARYGVSVCSVPAHLSLFLHHIFVRLWWRLVHLDLHISVKCDQGDQGHAACLVISLQSILTVDDYGWHQPSRSLGLLTPAYFKK